jgi:hypothetical protein
LTDQENIYKLYSNIKKDSEVKECFYHKTDECRGDIKNAHSISRSGRLDLVKGLVNKNEKVYSLSEIVIENGIAKKCIKDIGWSQAASTFFGFCDYHDTNLFRPIENNNNFNNSPEHCFLHSYRSFAFSFHSLKKTHKLVNSSLNSQKLKELQNALAALLTKISPFEGDIKSFPSNFAIPQNLLDLLKNQLNGFQNKFDVLKEHGDASIRRDIDDIISTIVNIRVVKDISDLFNKLRFLSNQLSSTIEDGKEKLSYSKEQLDFAGLHSGLEWMRKYKTRLDSFIEHSSYDGLKYYRKIKDDLFPFACAFAFSPDFLYSGINNFIIPPSNSEDILNTCLMITVLPDRSNKTIILFACFQADKQSEFFLNKLFSILNEEEFERAVTSIIVNKASNVFINPSMWEKLGERQNILEKEINIKRSFDELPEKPFMSEINFFSKEFSAKELGIR